MHLRETGSNYVIYTELVHNKRDFIHMVIIAFGVTKTREFLEPYNYLNIGEGPSQRTYLGSRVIDWCFHSSAG
jgi:hypothetical protein